MKNGLDKNFAKKSKSKLIKEKKRLEKELSTIKEEMQCTQSEESGNNTYQDSMADKGTQTFNRERDESLVWNIKDLINQVDDALQRIKDKCYGMCTNCKQLIDIKRLKALPWASSCIKCQHESER